MGCNIKVDPLLLAVLAALFTVIGDFLALLLAISEYQQQAEEKEKQKCELQQQIKLLQEQFDKFCN